MYTIIFHSIIHSFLDLTTARPHVDGPISELKEAIKAKKAPEFDNEQAQAMEGGNSWRSRRSFEEKLALLQALLNKSVHAVDVVVSPKRTKSFKWTVNIEHATLDGIKEWPQRTHIGLRDMLHIFVSKNNLKFTVFIETPSKPFSDWSFPKVCQLCCHGKSVRSLFSTRKVMIVLKDGNYDNEQKFKRKAKEYSITKGSNITNIYGISQNPDTKDYILRLEYSTVNLISPINELTEKGIDLENWIKVKSRARWANFIDNFRFKCH
ncbi:kinase-like domain-containing protein [Rhizophagus irregularis DAOM 181602=DAOM 197198]|nr:kinase-like domain-containing protein [Rhizophagus irregularis DAOM 181602=DAOM 197198]